VHLQKHLERGSSRLITLFVKTEAPHKSLRISGHMLALCNHTATAKFWRLAIDPALSISSARKLLGPCAGAIELRSDERWASHKWETYMHND